MANTNTENGGVPQQVTITIPSNSGTGSTLRDLCIAAGLTPADRCSMEVYKLAPGVDPGADRAAFVVATPLRGAAIATADFTARGKPIPAGESYYVPSDSSLNSYVRSTDGSTVSALVTVLE